MASHNAGSNASDRIVKHDGDTKRDSFTYVGQVLDSPQKLLGIDILIPEILPARPTLHGRGLCTWGNGDTYEGEYVDGSKSGRGIYTWSPDDGRRYDRLSTGGGCD